MQKESDECRKKELFHKPRLMMDIVKQSKEVTPIWDFISRVENRIFILHANLTYPNVAQSRNFLNPTPISKDNYV